MARALCFLCESKVQAAELVGEGFKEFAARDSAVKPRGPAPLGWYRIFIFVGLETAVQDPGTPCRAKNRNTAPVGAEFARASRNLLPTSRNLAAIAGLLTSFGIIPWSASVAQDTVVVGPGSPEVEVNYDVLDALEGRPVALNALIPPGLEVRHGGAIRLVSPGEETRQIPRPPAPKPSATPSAPLLSAAPSTPPIPPAPPPVRPIAPSPAEALQTTELPPSPPTDAPAAPPPLPPVPSAATVTAPLKVEVPPPATIDPEPIRPETVEPESNTQEPSTPEPIAPAAKPTVDVAALPASSSLADGASPPTEEGALRIIFAGDGVDLPADARKNLDSIATQLEADEALRAQVKAYAAGSTTTDSAARRLSLSRALAVRGYLIEQGVRSTRIDVRALGNKSADGPKERVDVVVAKR